MFPSLAALVAGGGLAAGCQAPTCVDSRAQELERHGRASGDAWHQGDAADALRQIGLAVGLVRHATRAPTHTAGAEAPVTQLPPAPLPPIVLPHDTLHPTDSSPGISAPGRMQIVHPNPPPTPRPPVVHTPTVRDTPHVMGRRARVSPEPVR